MNVPHQVAVMPLPNAILFPHVLLPLHIFEDRYRQMLADCLTKDRMFAIALLRNAHSKTAAAEPYPVATVGVIRACLGQRDGTSNLVLEGVARVSIHAYVQEQPYRIAQIEPLPNIDPAGPLEREPLLLTVKQVGRARARLGAKLPKGMLQTLRQVSDVSELVDLVSFTLLDNYHEKQAMLETLDVRLRLQRLIELLQAQTRQCELWKTLQGKLSNNDVGNN